MLVFNIHTAVRSIVGVRFASVALTVQSTLLGMTRFSNEAGTSEECVSSNMPMGNIEQRSTGVTKESDLHVGRIMLDRLCKSVNQCQNISMKV